MNEQQVAEQLKANIPAPVEHTVAVDAPPTMTGFGDASIELDEMTQYKLHDLFDVHYDPKNDEVKRQLQYIFEKAGADLEDKDYVNVAAKIRDLLRISGLAHSDRKIYKLYQWVRLANVMKRTQQEMENLR